MIPKIIHYCWFGRAPLPELALKCIESWHRFMPDYEYKLWNEDNFDVNSTPYTKEAYEAGKYAFFIDYVRMKALYDEGGLYLDVDFEVCKSFDDLLNNKAFAGFEGSKHLPLMVGVCGSEPHGEWVKEMLDSYTGRHFIINGQMDLTTSATHVTRVMHGNGFIQNGKEQYYKDLHIYPVEYFCPRQTTGEYFKTENTYCESLGLNSWSSKNHGYKTVIKNILGNRIMIRLIKLKRKLFD